MGGPREEEIGDVGAGDHEREQRRSEEEQFRHLSLLMQVARAAAAVDELQLPGLEERERLFAEALLQRRLDVVDDPMKEPILARLRLRERDARVHAREDVHPVSAAILVAVEALHRATPRDRHAED